MRGPMTRVEIRRAHGVPEPARWEATPAPAPTKGGIKIVGPFATPASVPAYPE
jgi:hypothetical protein